MQRSVILLHPLAPAKPTTGAACNGCGVCCMAEPCPVGMLLSRKRRGACRALRWEERSSRYRCGLMAPALLWPRLPTAVARLLERLARRWIAAGSGCDSDSEVEPA